MIVGAFLVAGLLPFFFLYLVHTLDLYGSGSPRTMGICVLWGGVAVALAAWFHQPLANTLPWLSGNEGSLWVAPPLEEILKALILLYLVRRGAFTYFVDGAIYGFAAGIGFAVFENLLYVSQVSQIDIATAAARVLSTNLMHASATAMVGIALGLSRFHRFSRRAFFLALGLALAVLFHAAFNRLILDASDSLLLAYAFAVGLGSVAFVALLVQYGLAQQKRWIEEKLGAADRITPAEAMAVGKLAQIDIVLEPLAAIFGPEKTLQIEAFLILQAQLGILRKTLDKAKNQRQRETVMRKIEETRAEMDAARRAVGAYTMASLRTLFPPQEEALWSPLEAALQEQRPPGSTDLFSLAASRVQERDR